VFLGRLNDEQVAVKKVRNASETDILHLRKLSHPNIIKFKFVIFCGLTDKSFISFCYFVIFSIVNSGKNADNHLIDFFEFTFSYSWLIIISYI